MKRVTFTYDPQADAVYVRLSRKAWAYTEQIDDQRNVDHAADGTPIGVELLYLSDGVQPNDLPQAELVARVIEVAQCLKRVRTSTFTRITIAA